MTSGKSKLVSPFSSTGNSDLGGSNYPTTVRQRVRQSAHATRSEWSIYRSRSPDECQDLHALFNFSSAAAKSRPFASRGLFCPPNLPNEAIAPLNVPRLTFVNSTDRRMPPVIKSL